MEKNQFISDKIKKLMSEGRPQDQAIAIAFSMWERGDHKEDGGYFPEYKYGGDTFEEELPQYQGAGTFLAGAMKVPLYMRTTEQQNAINKAAYEKSQAQSTSYPGISPQNQAMFLQQPQSANEWAQSLKPKVEVAAQQKQPTVGTITPVTKKGAVTPVNPVAQQVQPVTSYLKPVGTTYGTPEEQLQKSSDTALGQLYATEDSPQKDNTQGFQPNERIQFFNPYAGVDIPTAATALGQFVENDNALGIAGSGLKLATGLARNFFGGMGLQRRNNQVMDDYNEAQRNSLNRTEVLQDGGVIDNSMYQFGGSYKSHSPIVDSYTKPGSFAWNTRVALNSLEEDEQEVYNKKPEIPIGYNDTPEAWKLVDNSQEKDKLLPSVSRFGKKEEPLPQVFPQYRHEWEVTPQYQEGGVQQENQMQNIEQQIVEALQKGIQPEQIVQNLVQQGVPEEQVIQMVQAIMQQFQGASQQPQQQEQQFMQDGGSIDNKEKMAKALTGEYMFGMDKNNPMQRPNAEIEDKEFLQHPTGEIQQALGDTHENGGIDVKLEDNTKILSDHLKPKIDFVRKLKKEYNIDVKSSDTYSKILEKYNKKIGLSEVVEEQEELIKKMEKVVTTSKDEEALGLNTQYLSEKLKSLEDRKTPLEKARKSFFDELFKEQEDSKPKEEKDKFQYGGNFNDAVLQLAQKYNIPQEELSAIFKDGGLKLPEYQDGTLTDTSKIPYTDRTRLEDMYANLRGRGYTGSNKIGDMQAWMVKNYPEEVTSYFTKSGQPLTAKHVDLLKSNFKSTFNKAGVSANKASASYTPEEKLKLQKALEEADSNKDVYNNFLLEGFHDNKWDWRMPVVSANTGVNSVGMQGQQPVAPGLPNFYQAPEAVQSPVDVENLTEEERKKRGSMNMLLLPDQSPMLPGSLQAHLKVNRRFDRINPALISPEQALQELNRQTVATKERLNTGAGAERIAGELGLSAATQDNINKIVTDTEKLNSQIISNTDARNATIQATEENAAAQDALSYEQRQLMAKAKTDFDINNYYNTLRENNVRNYAKVNELNLLNQMYPDFQFTGTGVEKTSPNVQLRVPNTLPLKEEVSKKKKKTARNGGRFKS